MWRLPSIVLVLSGLLSGWSVSAQMPPNILWSIGIGDNQAGEFALTPDRYPQFLHEDFGWPNRVFVPGWSDPTREWPYVLPGPRDAWAGSGSFAGIRTQLLTVLFELEGTPSDGPYALVLDLTGASPSDPPRIVATVNGTRLETTARHGSGDGPLVGSPDPEQVLSLAVPNEALRSGVNEITLTSIEGSWIAFDQVRFEAPAGLQQAPAHPTMIRSVGAAPYGQPDPSTEALRPVLLVDVQQLGGMGRLRVDVDGELVWGGTVEPGRTVIEVPVPAERSGSAPLVMVLADGAIRFADRVALAPSPPVSPADYVDPFMGTAHSRWMIAPGPWAPFGMVKLSPDNQNEGWQAGYDPSIDNVMGFSHIHEWTMSGLLMMPTTGPLRTQPGDQAHPDDGYRSRIDKETETGGAGSYKVDLLDYGITAELTATTRASLQRYTFPPAEEARILLDLQFPSEYRYRVLDSRIRQVGPRRVEGRSVQRADNIWDESDQDYTVHFVVEFDRDILTFGGWSGDRLVGAENVGGEGDVGAFVTFDASEGAVVSARTGISLVDLEGASRNLAEEITLPFGWDFEAVVAHQRAVWNEILGRVEITTPDAREKVRFYTNLYRSYAARNIWSDVDGRWVDPDEQVRRLSDPGDPVLGCDAFWNTFWNLNQVWNLVTPAWSSKWVKSQLALYEAGGWLAKGPAGMEYVPVMVAEHEIPLLVAAYQAGIRDYDVDAAFDAVLKMQTTPGQVVGGGYAGNRDLEPYLKYGFIPQGQGRSSNTFEYAYDDWTVAQFARALGKDDLAAEFLERSGNWRNQFDAETGFARPRAADGSWIEPFSPVEHVEGFTEGNAWQYTWFVPQDVPGLVEAMGRERFVAELVRGFEVSEPIRFNPPLDRYGDFPVCHGNQPAMEVSYLFNYAGAPWLTQQWNRAIQDRYYGFGTGDAYLGDEDQGQMSGWFVMAAIGLFQTDGGASSRPIYELGSPRFPEVTLHLDPDYYGGNDFTLTTLNASRANLYIQSATLNGNPLDRWWLTRDEVLGGGHLVLEMGPAPNRGWPSDPSQTPPREP